MTRLSPNIQAILLSCLCSILITHRTDAQTCTEPEIKTYIEQFNNAQTVTTAVDGVVKCEADGVILLQEALSESDPAIRVNSAAALGKLGLIAADSVPDLLKALSDSDEQVRSNAANALIKIGEGFKNQQISELDFEAVQKLEEIKQNLELAQKQLTEDKRDWQSKDKEIEGLRLVANGLQTKLNRVQDQQLYQIWQWIENNPWILLPGLYLVGYLGIFALRPTFLLKLDEWVQPASLTIPGINLEISLRYLLVLKYHPRVLDAWVKQRVSQSRKHFFGNKEQEIDGRVTVRNREIHIKQPVLLGETKIAAEEFKAEHFSKIFNQNSPLRLTIWGEGGAGKTSLVCQLAKWAMWGQTDAELETDRLCKHRMLPILIEDELDKPLLEVISGQLKELTQEKKAISEDLVKKLLIEKRLLVIVDHLSERVRFFKKDVMLIKKQRNKS